MRRDTGKTIVTRVRAAFLGLGAAVALTFAVAAPSAQADLLSSFTASSSSTQAGAYADATTTFEATDFINDPLDRLRFHLPVGLLGTISNFTPCPMGQFYAGTCPMETQVGVGIIRLNVGSVASPLIVPVGAKVNVLVSGRGEVTQLGVNVTGLAKILLHVTVRPDDYGLDATVESLQNNVSGTDMTLWGVPWDHWDAATKAKTKRLPFMANPATCGDEAVTSVDVNSYANPGAWETYSATTPAQVGCDAQRFEPEISVQADNPFTSRPSSFVFGITVPQNSDPDGLQTPPLRDVTAVLPEGLTINPAVAGGLQACTDAEFGQGSDKRSTCPAGSRVGTAEFEVPVLQDPHLAGTVYIGQQLPNDTYRLFVEAYGSSVRVKLKGSVRPDPTTGRLTAVFTNNPQAPASSIKLTFKGGPRAALAMPDTCGVKPVSATIDSWGGQTARPVTSFGVAFDANGTPCPPQGFAPAFAAGTVNPVAGASSAFALRVHKADGQADLNQLAMVFPEGLLGNLKGHMGQRVGTARVAAGVGSSPFWLSGPVVLEGPYKGAPFSLRVTVPVIAGPFNLGNVVVRQRIYVDSHDAHVTVVSDPLPTIVKGIPVRLQDLAVDIDKPGFMRNPTSCAPKAIHGTLGSVTGRFAEVASRFQVGDCAGLPLRPKMAMELQGKDQVKRGKHPTLSTTLTQKSGESALRKVKVQLPLSLALDPDNAQALCKPQEAAAKACPAGSIVGHATAITPMLDQPLSGNVYFVEGTRKSKEGRTVKTLPKLWVALRGQVAIDLWADSAIGKNKALETTFGFVPDAPISSFRLDINGGDHGILAVTGDADANLCRQRLITTADYDGQNGRQVTDKVRMDSPCGFGVREKSLSKTHAKVTVSGIGAGKLTVSGKGIHKASRTIKHSSVATIQPRLTDYGMRAAKTRKALRLKVSWNPTKKGEKTKTARTTVKRAKASSTRSHRSR